MNVESNRQVVTRRLLSVSLAAVFLYAVFSMVGCASTAQGGKSNLFAVPKLAQSNPKPKKVEKDRSGPQTVQDVIGSPRPDIF